MDYENITQKDQIKRADVDGDLTEKKRTFLYGWPLVSGIRLKLPLVDFLHGQ